MTIQALFLASNEGLAKVIAQIRHDQWYLAMPPRTTTKPTSLEDAVRYHIYDDAWVPDVLEGKTIQTVGNTYEYLLELHTKDIQKEYVAHNTRANNAVRNFDNLQQMTHLSYGNFPARDYLQHIISFRAFRSYDIAKLIGADPTMSDDLVQALTEEFSPVIEDYRKMGVFPPAVTVADSASPQVKLLAMFGRS